MDSRVSRPLWGRARLPVEWMIRVERIAVRAHEPRVVSQALEAALTRVVAIRAEALKWPCPKGIPIMGVRGDVVDHRCRGNNSSG